MKIIDKDIIVRLVNDIDLENNSNEFIELLNENYCINFPHRDNLSDFVDVNFYDMRKFNRDGSALIIGSFIDEKIIGFLWAYKRIFLGESKLHISHVVVNSEFRGFGIGTSMINQLEKLALEKDIKVIELLTTSENTNTIQFYKNYGFNVTRLQLEKNLGEINDNK